MELDGIMLAAANKNSMPSNINPPEQWFYLSLRTLYSSFRKNQISKESAVKEKKVILRTYSDYADTYRKYINTIRSNADRIKKSDVLRCDFNKAKNQGKSANELLSIACECIRELTGDDTIKPIKSLSVVAIESDQT